MGRKHACKLSLAMNPGVFMEPPQFLPGRQPFYEAGVTKKRKMGNIA
jgi:hypothetical protein